METSETVAPVENKNTADKKTKPVTSDLVKAYWEKVQKLPPQIKIIAAASAVLVFLVFLILVTRPTNTAPLPSFPSPTPAAPVASAPPREISAFAKTPEFAQFETSITALASQSAQIDLSENALSYPFLDMNVNFQNN